MLSHIKKPSGSSRSDERCLQTITTNGFQQMPPAIVFQALSYDGLTDFTDEKEKIPDDWHLGAKWEH
jgi:hypothetical protein